LVTQYSLTFSQVLGDQSAVFRINVDFPSSSKYNTISSVIEYKTNKALLQKVNFDLADLGILRLNVESLKFHITMSLAAALITKDHLQP
jgi:hypothetical protein